MKIKQASEPDKIPLPTEPDIECLQWMLNRIASMESSTGYARWDQWLRYEFGDERADSLISYLKQYLAIEVFK